VEVRTAGGSAQLAGGFRYAQHLRRGDANGDLRLNITDAVAIIRFRVAGGEPPLCAAVADADGDLEVAIGDALFLLRLFFLAGPEPAELFADCE
jgi:hypothetical protein